MSEDADSRPDSAVRTVLDAEQRARNRVAEAEREAAGIVEAAREEARTTESEAVEHARAFRSRTVAEADQRIAELRATAGRQLEAIDVEAELPRIRGLVERIAGDLIGTGSS